MMLAAGYAFEQGLAGEAYALRIRYVTVRQ
jgi:hypothetical protein